MIAEKVFRNAAPVLMASDLLRIAEALLVNILSERLESHGSKPVANEAVK